jgi:hypothetical protein
VSRRLQLLTAVSTPWHRTLRARATGWRRSSRAAQRRPESPQRGGELGLEHHPTRIDVTAPRAATALGIRLHRSRCPDARTPPTIRIPVTTVSTLLTWRDRAAQRARAGARAGEPCSYTTAVAPRDQGRDRRLGHVIAPVAGLQRRPRQGRCPPAAGYRVLRFPRTRACARRASPLRCSRRFAPGPTGQIAPTRVHGDRLVLTLSRTFTLPRTTRVRLGAAVLHEPLVPHRGRAVLATSGTRPCRRPRGGACSASSWRRRSRAPWRDTTPAAAPG